MISWQAPRPAHVFDDVYVPRVRETYRPTAPYAVEIVRETYQGMILHRLIPCASLDMARAIAAATTFERPAAGSRVTL